MTTDPWPTPARSSRDWHGRTSPTEAAVEDAIYIGSTDCNETDRALRIIHALSGRCTSEIVTRIEEIIDLADEIANSEALHVESERYNAAIDSYAYALTQLSQPRSYDDAVTEAMRLPNGHGLELVKR